MQLQTEKSTSQEENGTVITESKPPSWNKIKNKYKNIWSNELKENGKWMFISSLLGTTFGAILGATLTTRTCGGFILATLLFGLLGLNSGFGFCNNKTSTSFLLFHSLIVSFIILNILFIFDMVIYSTFEITALPSLLVFGLFWIIVSYGLGNGLYDTFNSL